MWKSLVKLLRVPEPMRRNQPYNDSRRQSFAARGLAEKLEDVQQMPIRDLRAAWAKTYRRPPPSSLTKDLMARMLTHRLQERALGSLDKASRQHLAKLAAGNGDAVGPLKSGSVIVREHDGILHQVVIVPDGYLWNGETYSSLSTIASKITGTSWNGPRFFGLRGKEIIDIGNTAGGTGEVTVETSP